MFIHFWHDPSTTDPTEGGIMPKMHKKRDESITVKLYTRCLEGILLSYRHQLHGPSKYCPPRIWVDHGIVGRIPEEMAPWLLVEFPKMKWPSLGWIFAWIPLKFPKIMGFPWIFPWISPSFPGSLGLPPRFQRSTASTASRNVGAAIAELLPVPLVLLAPDRTVSDASGLGLTGSTWVHVGKTMPFLLCYFMGLSCHKWS